MFGSVVEGETMGASDVDVLIVIPDGGDKLKSHTTILEALGDRLGEAPYKWWVRRALRIA